MPIEYKRVRDKDTGSTYSVVASAFDPDLMDELDEPAVNGNGDPLPPSEPPTTRVEDMTVAQLKDAIDTHNAGAPEDAQLSKSGSKADLVAALTGTATTPEENS